MKKLLLTLLTLTSLSQGWATDYYIYDEYGDIKGQLIEDYREGSENTFIMIDKYGFARGVCREQ